MENEFKKCKVCGIVKCFLDFTKSEKYRLNTCKKCSYENQKKRLKSPENIKKIEEKNKLTGNKSCITCNEIKDFSFYHKNPSMKKGISNECKKCSHKRLQEARAKTDYKERFKVYNRRSCLKSRYGIDDKDFDKMVKNQNNRCLICNEEPKKEKAFQTWNLHVDHCHKTGKVRGLLCHLCNRGIGLFRERHDLLLKAFEYVKSHD